ncbi:MAG: hypothetical protein FWC76_03955 [Defluviitaleaceae bacterium]|nr:hypothetical protein [Defluviitaleaceae bacterium]
MKKTMAIFALAFVLILSGCGQGAGNTDDDGVIIIGERFFVNQVIEIVLNSNQYLGRTIQYEGLFRSVSNSQTGNEHFFVMRYTMGCCGIEMVGLEVLMEGATSLEDDAWVEVIGILEMNDGIPMLRVISITEMDEVGSILVS